MSLFRASPRQLNLGLAALRVAVATIFIRHGAQKLFVFGFAGVTDAFTHMGVPFPGVTVPLLALLARSETTLRRRRRSRWLARPAHLSVQDVQRLWPPRRQPSREGS